MFIKRLHTVSLFALTLVIALSCSQYEKALKSEDVNFKFSKAFYFYNKGDYVRASSLFEQLAPLTRGTRKADSVYFYQAMVNYKLNDYILAGHYFNTFVNSFANSSFIEEAAYMEAYCYYVQSPRPELDQTSTYQALDAFRLYMTKYPASNRIDDCQRIILELNEKLMEKGLISAQLYFNVENYKAAITSLNSCLIDYPDSKFREDIMFLLLKSKYILAVNSISNKQTERYQDAVDEYFAFKTEFPDSKNSKEADDIYQDASKHIKVTDNELTDN